MSLSPEEKKQLMKEWSELQARLSGDMLADMELKEAMHKIEMKLNEIKPDSDFLDCEGCGS